MSDDDICQQLVRYAQRAYARALVGGTGGNFSARLANGQMAVTATGVSLGDTTLENLITVDLQTYDWQPRGEHKPSKEYLYHADILRLRPEVGAVLHVHPPHATAYAVKKRDIPMVTDAAFKQPPMPRVPFAPSGSEALRQNVVRAVEQNPGCRVLLLEEHGIVALGSNVLAAYNTADLTEELARIAFLAEQLSA
jgi:ribulose-5-phosphate 4-epimerase/fuculose-1-phosphate aldolase